MNRKYKTKINIIKGIYHLLSKLEIDKKNELFVQIENLKCLLDKNIENSLQEVDKFFVNNKDIKEESSIVKFLEFLNVYPQLIKWLFEIDLESLYQFIIDSDFNDYLYISNINEIKKYFENLKSVSVSDIIKKIFKLEIENNNLIQNINDFCNKYPDLEKLSKNKEGKAQDFKLLLNELNNAIFLILFNSEKQAFKLESILSNEKELIDEYKKLILEKSFFAINHSKKGDEINNRLKKMLEISNYINEYISLLNNKRNILYVKEEKIYLKIKKDGIINVIENKPIKELIIDMKKKEIDEEKILNQFYCNDKYISLFSNNQLHKIYLLLIKGDYDELRKLFSPFFNNILKYYQPDSSFKIKRKLNDSFEKKLKIISNYLKNIIEFQGDFNEIFKKNEIKDEYEKLYEKNKIYIKSFNDDEYENDCLDIFYSLTGNLPSLSNIFIFDDKINHLDFLPFLYKVKKSELNCLFILILKQCKSANEDILLKK